MKKKSHSKSKETIWLTCLKRWRHLALLLISLTMLIIAHQSRSNLQSIETAKETEKTPFHPNMSSLMPESRNEHTLSSPLSPSLMNKSSTSSDSILSPENILLKGSEIARAFPVVPNHSWCIIPAQLLQGSNVSNKKRRNIFAKLGLLYVKLPRSASTFFASITRRIAKEHGRRRTTSLLEDKERYCAYKDAPVIQVGRFYGNRSRHNSFLWSSVRDPQARAMSRIWFSQVSIKRRSPTDIHVLEWLDDHVLQFGAISPGQGGFMLNFMTLENIPSYSAYSPSSPSTVLEPNLVVAHVQQVLESYDFIAVTERMDESLVVLQLLLGVETSDLMAFPSKQAGSYFYLEKEKYCRKLEVPPKTQSPVVREYLQSDDWFAKNYGDYVLYAAANRSLDLTIQALGVGRVQKALEDYRNLKQQVLSRCLSRVMEPCSTNGTVQDTESQEDCYSAEIGCGRQCLEELFPSAE